MYGLYKQATTGDCPEQDLKSSDFIKKAKYMAWRKHTGLSSEQAMQTYVKLVNKIRFK